MEARSKQGGRRRGLGTHNWQGEHIGKWLHAATLATVENGDPELSEMLHDAVNRLVATQLPNGYIGTYEEPKRYYVADVDKQWDVWTSRYVLYGLAQKMDSDKEPFLCFDESMALKKIVRTNPDSQGIPVFHIAGNSEELRPCFDATGLDAQGMKFTAAYSASTLCSPSRAAIMSGCSPARLHLTDWITGIRAEFVATNGG